MNIIYNQTRLFSEPKEEFSTWKKENPNWEQEYNIHSEEDGHSDYKRIWITFKDTYRDPESDTVYRFESTYTPTINTKTGEFYLDCRKRKIFAKFATFVFLRPLHTAAWTLYHGLGIGVANQVIKTIRGQQSVKDGFKNSLRSLADIIRTPAYGIALSIIDIAAVAFAAFKPSSLYKMREISGKLEMSLRRVTDSFEAPWMLAPCFAPLGKLRGNDSKKIQENLNNFAESQVWFRRTHRAPFNDCMHLYPKNKSYHSAYETGKNHQV